MGVTAAASKGSAKAWVNFDGTGAVGTNMTIRSSFNVASVFKNAVGDYTINLTTPMQDTNYVVQGSSTAFGTQTVAYTLGTKTASAGSYTNKTTSAVQVISNAGAFDAYDSNITIFR